MSDLTPAERMARAAQAKQAMAIIDPYFDAIIDDAKRAVFNLPISGKDDEVMKMRLTVKLLESIRQRVQADVLDAEMARADRAREDKITALNPEEQRWARS